MGMYISFFGMYLIYHSSIYKGYTLKQGYDPIEFLLGVAVCALGIYIQSRAEIVEETNLDSDVKNGDFALYIRPFDTDMSVYDHDGSSGPNSLFDIDYAAQPSTNFLERSLSTAISRNFPLVSVSEHNGVIQGLRHLGEFDDWQEVVKEHMNKANIIFGIPSSKEGTLWEIGALIDTENINKAIFIMPPSGKGVTVKEKLDLEDAWKEASAALWKRYQMAIPEYDRDGALFGYSEELMYFASVSLDGKMSAAHLARAINRCRDLISDP